MADFDQLPTNATERILEEMNAAEIARLVPVIVFLILIAVFGLLGNGLVCHVYRTRYRLSNSQSFILCLSAIDLFSCCVVIPFEIATVTQQYNFQLLWLCKISRSLNSLSTLSGSFLLVFIAIDRYRKVCHPFGWQISSNVARALCVATPLLGIIFSWPSLILYGKKTFAIPEYNITGTECSTDDRMKDTMFPFINQAIFGILFVVGVIIMSILYCLIGREVHKHARKMPKSFASSNTSIPMLSSSMGPRDSKVSNNLNLNGAVLSKNGSQKKYSRRSSRRRSLKEESDVSWADRAEHSTSEDDRSGETNKTNETCVSPLPSPEDVKPVEKKMETLDTDNDLVSEDSGIKSEHTAKEDIEEVTSGKFDTKVPTLGSKDLIVEEDEGQTDTVDKNGTMCNQTSDQASVKDVELEEGESDDVPVQEETEKQSANVSKLSRSPFGATVKGKLNFMKHRMSSVISRMTSLRSEAGGSGRGSASLGKVQYLKQARARRTAFLMFLITLFFILSHLPHLLLMLIRSMTSQFEESMTESGNAAYKFFLRSYFLDRAINPIIYGVCDSRFRSACKDVLPSCCRSKEK